MIKTDTGLAPGPGVFEEHLITLTKDELINSNYDLTVADPLIDSSKSRYSDWNWIIGEIASHYANYDGFVITHGTDTLPYTAAALSIALEGLNKPIILTAAMLPLSLPDSDGEQNLVDAMANIGRVGPGVWIQFAGKILHGARARKHHSVAVDAFAATSSPSPPARAGEKFFAHTYSECDISILTAAPGMSARQISSSASGADGLILRCFGNGTFPETASIREVIATIQIPVIAVSQCAEGGMSLGTYKAGRFLGDVGVVDGRDITMEAAYVKLIFAISHFREIDAIKRFLRHSVCGEL